jgi:hypothetical protein
VLFSKRITPNVLTAKLMLGILYFRACRQDHSVDPLCGTAYDIPWGEAFRNSTVETPEALETANKSGSLYHVLRNCTSSQVLGRVSLHTCWEGSSLGLRAFLGAGHLSPFENANWTTLP